MDQKPKKLLDQVRERIRLKNYSNKTEQAYLNWIKQYSIFHDKKHPQDMGAVEIEAFLTHLVVDRNVAASTQNQALSAILFLYREVLNKTIASRTHQSRNPKYHSPFVWRTQVDHSTAVWEWIAFERSRAIEGERPRF